MFYWRMKKHTLHSKLERVRKTYAVMFPLETFIKNLVWGYFGSTKVSSKTRKNIFKRFMTRAI